MKKILLYLSLLLSFYSYAVVFGPVEVSGKVIKYDKKTVTLKQKKGIITVPKGAIKKDKDIRTGNTVTAFIKIDIFNKIISKKYKRMLASQKAKRKLASEQSKKYKRKPASSEYAH